MSRIGLITFLAREYDEAIGFFVGKLDFELVEDTDNFDRDYKNWSERGVKFREQPRHEVYGTDKII